MPIWILDKPESRAGLARHTTEQKTLTLGALVDLFLYLYKFLAWRMEKLAYPAHVLTVRLWGLAEFTSLECSMPHLCIVQHPLGRSPCPWTRTASL